jgi:hypothetical protein
MNASPELEMLVEPIATLFFPRFADFKHGQIDRQKNVTVGRSKHSGVLLVVFLQNCTFYDCPHVRKNVL